MRDPLEFAPIATQQIRQAEPGSYDVTRDGVIRRRYRRVTRNQQCGCGSGRKHKDCCFGGPQSPHPMRVWDDQLAELLLSTPQLQTETKPMTAPPVIEVIETPSFATWGIVEIFGRDSFAGFMTEQVIAGQSFIQIAVPEVIDRTGEAIPAFIKFFNRKSIFSITPTTEAEAREFQGKCGSDQLPVALLCARRQESVDSIELCRR